MVVYTKRGDKGKTFLYSGKRVSKSNLQVKAYGSVDELSSFVGLVAGKIKEEKEKVFLTTVQKNLYLIMALLAGKKEEKIKLRKEIKKIEQDIDNKGKELSKLNRFILFQEIESAAWFNVLRTVCRRAEREVVDYFKGKRLEVKGWRLEITEYLNRLSDWFFIMARKHSEKKEILI